ncbi:MAG: hypothetical protein IPJ06_11965 [Saprospiraceae bacterium]|nr:hypothetical protein [Saprospiraceae bacterium]
MDLEQSTLVTLIRALPQTSHREVRKFLASPFFTTRDDMIPLFEQIANHPVTDKSSLWTDLYPDHPFDDQQLRLLMSYLHKLLETYVSLSEWASDDVHQCVLLAVGYRKRGMNTVRSGASTCRETAARAIVEKRGISYCPSSADGREVALQTVQNPADAASFQEMVHQFDAAYLSGRLRLICMAYAQRQVYHTSLESLDVAEVVSMAERAEWDETPAVVLYLACYRMLRDPVQIRFFHAFTSLLERHREAFEQEEIRGLYQQAINYCVRRLNSGDDQFFREVLRLYQSGLANGYLLEQGILSRFAYHNIVAAALHAGELEWVNHFIHDAKGLLERKYRESSFSFNLARLEYHRKRFDAVLELLQKANYRDPLLNLAARTLLLKTWYESGETELLQSHLDAMRNYIQRKRVIGYHKENYLNIVRYTDRLLRVNTRDAKGINALKKAILEEGVLTERDWFLTCLEEFY